MYRSLASRMSPGKPYDDSDLASKLFMLHPEQLHRYLDAAWPTSGVLRVDLSKGVFLGEDQAIQQVLQRPPGLVDDPLIPGLPPATTLPWEHLIYAYLVENTGVFRIFRRVTELYAIGEALEVPQDVTRRWLRTTEELLYRDPPAFHIGSVTSDIRPNLEATRRNAYWRLLGMDLDHGGPEGRPYLYPKVEHANIDFVANLESLLQEVWQGYINRVNFSGENNADAAAVSNRAMLLAKGLRVRRLRGNLAREEFYFTAVMSWFHLTLESNNPVVADLKATADHPADRLRKIGERVGIAPHPRARDLLEMAEAASSILRMAELEMFNNVGGAAALYDPTTDVHRDVLKIINHWSAATGRNLKTRRSDLGAPVAARTGSAQARMN